MTQSGIRGQAAPLRDYLGTVLVLGTANGSLAIPTTPKRPFAVNVVGAITTDSVYRLKPGTVNETAFGVGGYMNQDENFTFGLEGDLVNVTHLHGVVENGVGTLYVGWMFGK